MAAISEDLVTIRFIQGLTALLSCLPANGKARELFSLALDLNEGPVLAKIGPPKDPDSAEGMKTWLESLWAAEGLAPEERRMVEWQNDSDNMTAAIREFQDVAARLRPA